MNSTSATQGDFKVVLRRQARTVMYVAGPILAIVIGFALGLPDVYRSTGVMRIDQSLRGANRAVDVYAEYYIETLAGQVLTPENMDKWVSEFGLYADEAGWTESEKAAELGENLKIAIVATPVIDPISGRERDVVTGFEVSFDSRSPGEAKDVATAAVDAFLIENRESRQARGQDEIDLFEKESDVYRGQIAEVEERLAEFKERNSRQLPELMQVNMSAMDRVERDLEATQLQVQNLKRERIILQSQLGQIPSTSDEAVAQLAALQNEYVRVSSIYKDTHPTVVSVRKQIDLLSQTVDSAAAIPILRQQQDEISVALAQARERYSEDHPDVRQLVRSENAIKDRIVALAAGSGVDGTEVVSTNDLYIQLETQVKAIDSEISGLNTRLAELRFKRDEYEKSLLQTPQVEREYLELSRDLANARELYEEMQEKRREAELALALIKDARGEQLILAQPPFFPKSPAWPPRLAIIVLGLILAPGLGIGVATLREISSEAVRSSRDVFELCGTPPIALIPPIRNRNRQIKQRVIALSFLACIGAITLLTYLGARGI